MSDAAAPTTEILNAYLDDDEARIVIHERAPDGRRVVRRVRAEHVTWHRAAEIGDEGMRQIKSLSRVRTVKTIDEWVRVGWADRWARRDGVRGMRAHDVDVYEGDVDPVMLWLVEQPSPIARPRRCYLDLETDSRVPLSRKEDMRVLSWALVDADTGEERWGVLEREDDDAERALLLALRAALEDFDQLVVWEGDWKGGEFDTVVLPARMRVVGVDFDQRRWCPLNQLAVWRRMNMHSAESGAEKESFKLEDIAHEQIGEGKEPVPDFVRERFGEKAARGLGALTWELWEEGGRFRELLVEYNRRDARLLRKLEAKKGYVTLFHALCTVCGIVPETRSLQPTRQMDGYMLRLGRRLGRRFATRRDRDGEGADSETEEATKFKGAFVLQPRTLDAAWRAEHGLAHGILRNVHVCDFAGMYPSIMLTFNLGLEVKVGRAADPSELKPGTCLSPGTGLVTRLDEHGMVTLALRELMRLRKEWADRAAQLPPGTPEWQDAMARSTAYKVAANSFYGAGGSPFSRFYDRDVSESTTQNGVYFLKLTMGEAERRKMTTVYGDSISGDRPVVLRRPDGRVFIGPIEEAWEEADDTVSRDDGKEVGTLSGWTALARNTEGRDGWFPVKAIIRHRTSKEMWLLSSKRGQTEVTSDHSLMVRGERVRPAEFIERGLWFDSVRAQPTGREGNVVDLFEHVSRFLLTRGRPGGGLGVKRFDAWPNDIRLIDDAPELDARRRARGYGERRRGTESEGRWIRRFYEPNSAEMAALLRVLGAYISEGSASLPGVTTCRYMASFAQNRREWIDALADDLRAIIPGIELSVIEDPAWNGFHLRSGAATLCSLMVALCWFKSRGKRLPEFAYDLGPADFDVLWQSLVDGDGHREPGGQVSYTTKSKTLVAGLSYCLDKHGIDHAIHYRESKRVWAIRTRPVGKERARSKQKVEVRRSRDEYVYDLSVEGAETFTDGVGRVLLHNTDSVLVVGPSIEAFGRFIEWLNARRFPEEVSRHGCAENHIKIAFEKSFDRIVFVAAKRYIGRFSHYKWRTTCNVCRVRKGKVVARLERGRWVGDEGGEPGSVDVRTLRCGDCGHAYDRIPRFLGKPEIKGLEWKRGDKGKLARELQGRVIDLLVGGVTLKGPDGKDRPINDDVAFARAGGGDVRLVRPGERTTLGEELLEVPVDDPAACMAACRLVVERAQRHVLLEPLTLEEVRWSKALSKSLREYGKDATEVHVRVARALVERGQHVARGMRVEFVVVDGGVSPMQAIPVEDYAGECDRYYLWERVYSPTQGLLEKAFPNERWDEYEVERPPVHASLRPAKKGAEPAAVPRQLGLQLGAFARANANAELAVSAWSARPMKVRIPEAAGLPAADRVAEVLRRHPGARHVEVTIALVSGGEVVLATSFRVSPSPALLEEVERAIAGDGKAPAP